MAAVRSQVANRASQVYNARDYALQCANGMQTVFNRMSVLKLVVSVVVLEDLGPSTQMAYTTNAPNMLASFHDWTLTHNSVGVASEQARAEASATASLDGVCAFVHGRGRARPPRSPTRWRRDRTHQTPRCCSPV